MMKSYLQAVSYYFPKHCLSNESLSEMHPEWSVEKISSKTGIYNRYISEPNETAGDMAFQAANKLFEEYVIDKADIDYILLCTQSPDFFLPTTACILQNKLGLNKTCGAIDYNLGCSGFVYGLGLAKGLIVSEQAKNVLLITSETYSKHIHPLDKSSKTIFGDGAAASLISSKTLSAFWNAEIMNLSYFTDGNGYDKLIVKNGAMRNKIVGLSVDLYENEIFISNDDFLYMDGKAIFDFTSFEVPQLLNDNLIKNGIQINDVDLFIFHQANKYMLNIVRNRCNIPDNKFYVSLSNGGNTVSSTIPIALRRAGDESRFHQNSTLLLCGFGVGLSMAAVTLKLNSSSHD